MFETRDYDQALLLRFLNWIRETHPQKEIVVLTDRARPDWNVRVFQCSRDNFPPISSEDFQKTIFYCIFDSDQLAMKIVGWIVDHQGVFYPPPLYSPPASYVNFHDDVRSMLVSEFAAQRREGFDKWDCGPGDMINLVQAINATASLPGCFVEIGVFRGSSARVALRHMSDQKIKRSCYFLDVFTGFDYREAQESPDRIWKNTHETEGIYAIKNRLMTYHDPDNGPSVQVLQHNIITDPLPEEIRSVALANIDVDMYEAVLAALTKVSTFIVKNGIIIAEDAGHTPALIGARLALQRFMDSEIGSLFLPIYMESGQTFLIRK